MMKKRTNLTKMRQAREDQVSLVKILGINRSFFKKKKNNQNY